MDNTPLEDLVRRLTALVVKLDERDDQFVARFERQDAILEELQAFTREQREFNRQQLQINARLETLMTEVFRARHNGREA